MSSNARVLCVDDEPNVLEGLKRTLRRSFEVTTAVGPEAGLLALEQSGPFAAIVSDLNMPGMDGVAFFEESQKIAPDSARVLLTGQADLRAAMDAVNRGSVFRFLLKPCAPDVLIQALADSVEKYDWLTKERSVLEQSPSPAVAPVVSPRLGWGGDTVAAAPATRDGLKKFLVVDPSATMRRMIVNSLERIGYSETVEVHDGLEALRAFGTTIRCVITEWDLPHSSGLEVVRALRERPDGRDVPIVIVTTRSARAEIIRAKEAGVNAYIVKPFTMSVLKEKLDAVLRATR